MQNIISRFINFFSIKNQIRNIDAITFIEVYFSQELNKFLIVVII